MRRFIMTLVLLSGVFVASGCSGPKTAEVSGTVTYKTKPLSGVTINFMCSDNSILTGLADDKGMYTIPKVPEGAVKISVTTPPIAPPNPQSQGKGGTGEIKATAIAKVEEIKFPDIYKNPETSKLAYTVTGESKQTYNIDLK